ncbi:hypothetical protein SAMN04515666_110105 [Bosea lupini]|uniref:Uncharacterized protein n=1 Tax=Bosea lupini TaxID=1036779 RepID=A0A1H7XNP8_9HYPH|nr:hypothetical protein [Bosea lupini]SEM35400.1 hypothetical protein SAMN04515666_110105 [Bosea lupini]
MLSGFSCLWRLDGRLGRGTFAGYLLLACALLLVVAVIAERLLGLTWAEDADPRLFVEPIPNAAIQILLYWTLLALAIQRIRDTAFPVLPVIAVMAAIELLEYAVLPMLMQARLPAPLETMTPVGGALSIASLLFLLLWPSATDRAPSSAQPGPSRRSDAAPPPPA